VRAIELGWSVIYYTVEELLQQLKRRAEVPVAKQRGRAYVKTALVIVDEMATTAILDRLFHKSHIFNTDGRNFRPRNLNIRLNGPAKEED